MPTLVKMRRLFLPVTIGFFVVLAAGLYNFAWLPSQHKYLDNRNFRLLSTLGEQISSSINIFDKILDNAADSDVRQNDTVKDDENATDLNSYLKQVAPRLESLNQEDQRILGDDYSDPPTITVRADEGTHFLYFAFKRTLGDKDKKYAVRTDLDKLIRGLLPPSNRNPFDVLLVAQTDGTVIFQNSAPGLAVTNIDTFEDQSVAAKADTPASAGAKPDKAGSADVKMPLPSRRYSSNKFSEINLAGTPYRLYSQPMQLSFSLNHPERKEAEGKIASRPTEQWVVFGLVRAEAFRSESESISYTYFLWISAAILLALFAPPFLKLFASAPAERLRVSEVSVSAVFACAVAATLTFMLLDLFHWRKDFDKQAKKQMQEIAIAIDANFVNEQNAALTQLGTFSTSEELLHALAVPANDPKDRPKFKGTDGECDPVSACRTQILAAGDPAKTKSPPLLYPYLQFATWSDSKGNQKVKWTIRGHATPFINLNDESIPYYPAIKRALEDPPGAPPSPAKGIGTLYSPTTGYNITTFWQLMTEDGERVGRNLNPEKRKKLFCASLVTRPISVSGPVLLPADFQFAIVDKDGLVIFHSDFTRNLRENFFAETDEDMEIRSRVHMRTEGALGAKYMGRSHRMYIRPMHLNTEDVWSVIVFRDLRPEHTMNLEVLSVATIMFLGYALLAALAAGSTLWVQKRRGAARWLWPDSRKAATYRKLTMLNGVAILLLLVLSEIPMKLALLFCAVCVPVGVLVLNLVALKREAERSSPTDTVKEKTPARWQLLYAGTCATLLAVVAVLPCLSFFKVAWDFEQKLFIERSQLRLIDEAKARRENLRAFYQGVALGEDNAKKLLADSDGRELGMIPYTQSFLDTKLCSGEQAEKQGECSLKSTGGPEGSMETFLGRIRPPYNQIAADASSLAAASPDIWKWSSGLADGKEYLELQPKEGENQASVRSLLPRLHVPWGVWQWWVGSVAFLAALFWLSYFGLRRVFLLDLDIDEQAGTNEPHSPDDPVGPKSPVAPFHPASLIATLSKNLILIGRNSSPTIASLLARNDVQVYDLSQPLSVPLRRAASGSGGYSDVPPSTDPIEEIVRIGRPVVFYNFEAGLEGREQRQQKLGTLERVLCRLPRSVVITSTVDPVANVPESEREQWQMMLHSFVRIDLNSSPMPLHNETADQFESRISAQAYYHWLLAGRSRAQKLALVHLAQERVVNPNTRGVVRELMKDGLVVRQWGMLSIKDHRFAHFLKSAIPRRSIKHWEKQGAGIHAGTLRTALVVAGVGIAGFLLYTQGAIFNNWVTYMTGIAAAVPAVLKLIDVFLRGDEMPAH